MRFSLGSFYGVLQQSAEVSGIGLTETVYAAHTQLPVHSHANPYFCLVLKGEYAEFYKQRQQLCRPAMLVFHPAGEAHGNRFGKQGGHCFNLEFGAAWPARLHVVKSALDAPAALTDYATVGLATRLRREFQLMDDVSTLVIESLALELIAAVARKQTSKDNPHNKLPWLKQAEQLIRARFAESLTLSEIAAIINRHPVHLARQFRRHHGCTIGDYIRRLRLESACRRLTTTDETLVMIALACGFAGQSHFSAHFKRATGMSPAQYREAFRTR